MLLLSKLSRFEIVDRHGRRSRLEDLSVAMLKGDYPPITSLIYSVDKEQSLRLPWEAVNRLDTASGRIEVDDLCAGKRLDDDTRRREVLLRRDVQDALLLDLEHRRATRANDIVLREDDGQLSLGGIDASLRAITRRITRGRLFPLTVENQLSDWKYIEFLRGEPHLVPNGAGRDLRITRLPPGEIATLSNFLPYLHAAELLVLLPDPLAADTLELLPADRQLQVFEELGEDQGTRLLNLMAPDIVTDLIGRLEPQMAKRYIEHLDETQRKKVLALLRFPEDTVGGIMTNDVVCLDGDLTVAQARMELKHLLKRPDFVKLIYVIDDVDTRKIRGVVSLTSLLVSADDMTIEELMDPYVITLDPLQPATEAAYRVINTHLAAMPVVSKEGMLMGVVTVDAAVAQVAPASWSEQAPRIFS
jgi:CBS domain-containing protein